jgi:hypothetical protein
MSTIFSVKTHLIFEPNAVVPLGVAEVSYTTPSAWRQSLGGMGLINGLKATLKACIVRGGSTDVVGELSIKTSSGTVLETIAVNLPANSTTQINEQIDVGGISVASPLLLSFEVTTVETGESATLNAVIEYETPVIASGC